MSDTERTFSADITETDLDLLSKLIDTYAKRCNNNADMCRNNGYGTSSSSAKAEDWERKATEAYDLLSRLAENAV